MHKRFDENMLRDRLANATDVELTKLRVALRLGDSSDRLVIHDAFFEAAGNSLANSYRKVTSQQRLQYHEILVDVLVKIAVAANGFSFRGILNLPASGRGRDYFNKFDIKALEQKILDFAKKSFDDRISKLPALERAKYGNEIAAVTAELCGHSMPEKSQVGGIAVLTGLSSALIGASSQAGILGFFASRSLPMLVGGTAAGVLSVALIPLMLSGPAFRKVIPATIELTLIGQRLEMEKAFD